MTDEATATPLPGYVTWSDVVTEQARRIPDRVAIVDDHGQRVDYRELDGQMRRAAAYWRASGIEPGDRVAVLGRNSVEVVANLLGLAFIGATPVMLNWRLTTTELAELGDICTPRAVAHDVDFDESAAAVLPDGLRVPMVRGQHGSTSEWAPETDAAHAPPAFALLHTSGTTGLPKFVALSQVSHLWGCRRLIEMSGQRTGDVHLRFTPLFHLAGLQEIVSSILSGGITYLQAAFDPDRWLDAVAARGVNYGHLPPSTMRRVVEAHAARAVKPDLSTLREVWYGTAPAGRELVSAALAALGCDLLQVYGATEALSPVSILPAVDHRSAGVDRLDTAGRLLPEWEARFRAPDGTDVPDGEPGELLLRGGRMFTGYWTAEGTEGIGIDEDGWYATGDVAVLDEDRYLTIVDRAKDMVISGGENVYPAEVERALADHPQVAEISAVGVPDETWGESVCAVVVPRAETELDRDEFLAWARTRLAGFKAPRSVVVVEALPRNANGKVLKRDLRAELAASDQ